MLPGEMPNDPYKIIKCSDCGVNMHLNILRSNAGWYLGHACCCGPHSRSSGYYSSFNEAEIAMRKRDATWRDGKSRIAHGEGEE